MVEKHVLHHSHDGQLAAVVHADSSEETVTELFVAGIDNQGKFLQRPARGHGFEPTPQLQSFVQSRFGVRERDPFLTGAVPKPL